MSIAISLHNISKRYRLGTVNQRMLLDDLRDWRDRVFPRFRSTAAPARASTPEFWALKDISFDIKKGETVGLIGTNGAGKSTLLKLLARVTTPTTGEMVINGRVGTLLEVGSGFHPELTGRDNVYLNGAVLGMSRVEIDSKFDEILDFAELHQFIDTPVKRYSSGMRVRLAFSVAAIIEPEIMILDEVLAVGDLGFREKCLHRIEVLASGGQTGLFVSHSIGHVSRLCSRVIWLEKGRVRMDGDTDAVCEEYRKAQIIKLAVHAPSHAPALHLAGESSNSAYKILSIETRDGLGRPSGRFRTGEPCRIAVKYASNFPFAQAIEKVTLRLSILNEQGNRLIGLDSSLVKPRLVPFPDAATVCFAIPRLPLMEGSYSFSLALSVNGELIDKVIPEAFFLVEDGDFYGTGRVASPSFTPLCVDFSCYLEDQRNPAYKILSVETLDASGRPSAVFRTAQPCCIAVQYTKNHSLAESIRKVTMRLSVVSDTGVRVIGMDSSLVKPLFIPFPDADTVYFELPKLPLAAGTYSFVVSLFMNAEVIDEYVPEAALIVERGDFYGTRRAALPAFAPVCVEFDCYLKGRKGLHPPDASVTGESEKPRPYKIVSIEARDSQGRPSVRFRTADPCRIAVKYSNVFPMEEGIRKATLRLSILDARGNRLIGMDSSLVRPLFLPFPDADTIYFELPKLPLAAGAYSLKAALFMNGGPIDEYSRLALLTVEDGDFYGTRRAAIPGFAPVCVEFDCYLEGRKGQHPPEAGPIREAIADKSSHA